MKYDKYLPYETYLNCKYQEIDDVLGAYIEVTQHEIKLLQEDKQ